MSAVDLVALLRADSRLSPRLLSAALRSGAGGSVLEEALGLLAAAARARAQAEIEGWRSRGISVLTPLEDGYPAGLRALAAPPPLLFLAGTMTADDARAVAVVGTRRPSERGTRAARAVAARLARDGLVVASGLAAGVDTEAHRAALAAGGRTIAVIGCGLDHCYPPQNAALQRTLASQTAVLSQFWPEARPTRRTFPLRNGTMAAMTIATVIIEAGATSGTRIQARLALDCGRRVLLLPDVAEQPWARELAQRPGVTVVGRPSEVGEVVATLASRARVSEAESCRAPAT